MIEFLQVSKRFGGQEVLVQAGFRIGTGERLGIVGPNGAGKSTVFSLIIGELTPDEGNVVVPAHVRIGHVRQDLQPHTVPGTLLDTVQDTVPELQEIHAETARLEKQLDVEPAAREATLRTLGELQTKFEHLGGYALRSRAEAVLSGLGFAEQSFSQPFQSLSGGWQLRAELARILVMEPQILLLDEPSNYLDIPAVEWLQRHLREFRGTLALISHDRHLLNTLTTATLEIANARATRYPCPYDEYAAERIRRQEQQEAARKNQDRRRAQIERFVERFRSKNTKASQVQSRIKMLEKMDTVEVQDALVSPGTIRLSPPPRCGVEVMRLEQAGVTYDDTTWVLRDIDLRIERGEKTALVGLNGMGKTTLLRALAGARPLSEGNRVVGHGVVIGYQSQAFAETVPPGVTVFEAVKSVSPDVTEQATRTLLGGFGFSGDAVKKHVDILSGGEKIRVAFARLLIRPPNLLLLDEPTTHLDIMAREALEEALRNFAGTVYFVSHDIAFVRHVASSIIAMTPPGITRYAGDYDYYREKTGLNADASTDAKGGPAAGNTVMGEDARKARRRERAHERQERHAQTKGLKADIAKCEDQIQIYEQERARLIEQLSSAGPSTDFAELNRRLKELQSEIERYTQRWEQRVAELEAMS